MIRVIRIPVVLTLMAVGLAACGSTPGERAVTGAGIGAGAGLIVDAPVTGAVIGGAVGGLTDKDDLDLGEPIWEW